MGTIQNYTYTANSLQTAYTCDTLNRLRSVGSAKGTTTKCLIDSLSPTGYAQVLGELTSAR